MIDSNSKDFITSLARGLEVLACFNESTRSMAPADVAAQTGLTRATARRALLTLESIGYMTSDGKTFSLTPKVLALSQAYLSSTQISNHIMAIVKKASISVDETCSFGIRDDNEVIIVARHFSSRLQNLLIEIGTRLPMDVTALGRAILAGLPEQEIDVYLEQLNLQKFTTETIISQAKLKKAIFDVQKKGIAIVDGELNLGTMSIAMPILTKNGDVYGAINFGGTSARFMSIDLEEKILPALKSAATSIEELLY